MSSPQMMRMLGRACCWAAAGKHQEATAARVATTPPVTRTGPFIVLLRLRMIAESNLCPLIGGRYGTLCLIEASECDPCGMTRLQAGRREGGPGDGPYRLRRDQGRHRQRRIGKPHRPSGEDQAGGARDHLQRRADSEELRLR